MHTIAEKKLLMLKPDDIIPNANQPRKFFDEYELQTLADSISVSGIIQPLTVRKGESGKYILISGERRLRAAKIAGLRRVPCVLHRTDETTAALYSLVENLAPKVIANERQMYKGVSINVDFYSGFVYQMLGLPLEWQIQPSAIN